MDGAPITDPMPHGKTVVDESSGDGPFCFSSQADERSAQKTSPRPHLLRCKFEIRDPNFVASLNQESEFAFSKVAARLREGIQHKPILAASHLRYQVIGGRIDLNREGLL